MKYPREKDFPKYIWFGPERYEIRFVKRMRRKGPQGDLVGDTDSGKHIIRILHGLNGRERFRTAIHEVLHLLEFEHEIKIKHKTIYDLSDAILQLMEDNL